MAGSGISGVVSSSFVMGDDFFLKKKNRYVFGFALQMFLAESFKGFKVLAPRTQETKGV